jgi:hypothetical protein
LVCNGIPVVEGSLFLFYQLASEMLLISSYFFNYICNF